MIWEKILRFSGLLLLLMTAQAVGLADTVQVPGEYDTIQEGIDAAVDGDTVLVAAGTYFEHIDFKGKAICVTGESKPEVTVIHGNQAGSVVTFAQGEDRNSVLDGFTITNGGGKNGGGIFCDGASPTLTHNIIVENLGWYGAGIYCSNASPLIKGNIITENTVVGSYGGGGICCLQSFAQIADNLISLNSADYSTADGGGIMCFLSSDTIVNNVITENSAVFYGGGISYCAEHGGSVTIANNIIHDNYSSYKGGGIYLSGNFIPLIVNCTIVKNYAKSRGGGLCIYGSKYPQIFNSIFWENVSPNMGAELFIGVRASPSHILISHSLVQGGLSKVYVDGSTLEWGENMIEGDPLFANPANNYHLTHFSPCINRGSRDGYPLEDFDHDPRPCMGTADIGADEYIGIHPLEADSFSVSATLGGTVAFSLSGGMNHSGRNYIVLGSVTGTVPGTPLPGGAAILPLNWDAFTTLVLNFLNHPMCMQFLGTLDSNGEADAAWDTLGPIPSGAGLWVSFAYALNDPWDIVSNPIDVAIIP